MGVLSRLGAGRGEKVALLLENSPEFIAAHYALASLGAVIVPLNQYLPVHAQADALDMCGATLAVTRPSFWRALEDSGRQTPLRRALLLESRDGGLWVQTVARGSGGAADPQALDGLPEDPVPGGPGPDDDGVLFLTSGTTGTPKGIRVTHRQVLFGLDAWVTKWAYRAETVSLMVAPFFHVVYNPLVLGAHRRGGAVAIPASLQMRAVMREVEHSRVTSIMGTPFFYMQFLNDRAQARDLSTIDTVIYGAAETPVPVIRSLQRRFPAARLFNCYGLTEACSAVSCLGSDELFGRESSVGRAHPGVEISIRDDEHKELPPGEPGQVCCRGPNVITGYYKAPQADATRFRDGWLLTGDIGYLDREAFLYLLGRSDDLMNVGGDKAYPCDVENVLHGHPDVLDAAVSVIPDPARGQVVKAYIVPREGRVDLADLKRFCIQNLSAAFVPRVFALVQALPRNPSGKIVRRQLADMVEVEAG
jgi:acyl-CoA synthetase (AMP-forming)/AMP-acid ligase II